MGATHSINVNNNHSHSHSHSNSKIHTTNTSRQCGASDRLAVSNLRSQLTTIYRNHEDEEEDEEEEEDKEEKERRFALVRDFDLSGLKRIRVPRRNHILMDPHKKVRPFLSLWICLISSSDSELEKIRFLLSFCQCLFPTTLEGTVANHCLNVVTIWGCSWCLIA